MEFTEYCPFDGCQLFVWQTEKVIEINGEKYLETKKYAGCPVCEAQEIIAGMYEDEI